MIQRIQSIWLLLVSLLMGLLFMTKLYTAKIISNQVVQEYTLQLTSVGNYFLLVAGILIIVMSFFAIFMFRNRKNQRNMVVLTILATIGFIALMLAKINELNNTMPTEDKGNGHYGIGAILPVFSLILLILALRGIIKDDKLVKSTDRLR